jgi:sulfocyanin
MRAMRRALLAAVLGGISLLGARGHVAQAGAAPAWLTYSAKAHTASLTIIAGYNNALGGFNFDGYGQGKLVVTIPVGYKVTVAFSNKGALPHSVVIVQYAQRNAGSYKPTFPGAASPNSTAGIGQGPAQKFSFLAKPAGTYAIVCAVPGHEPAGMWDTLKVVSGGTPSITPAH